MIYVNYDIQKCIFLSEDQIAELKEIAAANKSTVSGEIRYAIDRYINECTFGAYGDKYRHFTEEDVKKYYERKKRNKKQ